MLADVLVFVALAMILATLALTSVAADVWDDASD